MWSSIDYGDKRNCTFRSDRLVTLCLIYWISIKSFFSSSVSASTIRTYSYILRRLRDWKARTGLTIDDRLPNNTGPYFP